MGTLETHLQSLFHPDIELHIPPYSWQGPPLMVTCSDQTMGWEDWAMKQNEQRSIFQGSFSRNQLGLGPREAGIYVLPLITLADILQTRPTDTVLTRAGLSLQGRPVSRDSCPGELLARGLELQDGLALWHSPCVPHPTVSLACVQGSRTQGGGRRETTPKLSFILRILPLVAHLNRGTSLTDEEADVY